MKEIDPSEIQGFFEEQLASYGNTPEGVGWNSVRAQVLRFEQLARVIDPSQPFSLIDYGCGYGALIDFLADKGFSFDYIGYDLAAPMVTAARVRYKDWANCRFFTDEEALTPADYTVTSGIFNVKLDNSEDAWQGYVLKTLDTLNRLSRKGFAFNMLTKYSDPERMRADLYYGDPGFFFDYCKTHYARNVALLHDYGLYDYTIIVRKQVA